MWCIIYISLPFFSIFFIYVFYRAFKYFILIYSYIGVKPTDFAFILLFLYAFFIYLSIFSHYFSVPVGFFGYILTNIRSKGAAPDHITVIRFASTDFRIKTADETLIDRSDIGHYNFAESGFVHSQLVFKIWTHMMCPLITLKGLTCVRNRQT